jgi:hypothetical protein
MEPGPECCQGGVISGDKVPLTATTVDDERNAVPDRKIADRCTSTPAHYGLIKLAGIDSVAPDRRQRLPAANASEGRKRHADGDERFHSCNHADWTRSPSRRLSSIIRSRRAHIVRGAGILAASKRKTAAPSLARKLDRQSVQRVHRVLRDNIGPSELLISS